MLKIYFDNVLIDSDNYISLSVNNKLFDDSFRLGSVPSETLTLEVPSSFSIPNQVKIYQDDIQYGLYLVDKAEYKDGDILSLILNDDLILTEKPYDASTIIPDEDHSATTKQIFEDICNKAGIEYDSSTFTTNNDVLVNYYDNTINGREYLSYLGELNGGYIAKNSQGKTVFKKFNSTPVNLNTEDCESFKIGQKHEIERVVYDNGKVKYAKARPSQNLFDNSQDKTYGNPIIEPISTGVKAICTNNNTYQYVVFKLMDVSNLIGETFSYYADFTPSGSNTGQINIGLCNSNAFSRRSMNSRSTPGKLTLTIPNDLDDRKYLCIWCYANGNGTSQIGDFVTYTNMMVVKGNLIPPYEPYGDLSEWVKIETLYLNPLNPYITSQEIFNKIADQIIGFKYYNFTTTNCPIDIYAKAGDLLKITDGSNEYQSIIQYELNYNGTWLGGYELNLASQIQQETEVIGDSPEQRAIKIVINRLNNTIEQTIVDLGEAQGNISGITQNQSAISSLVAGLNKGYYEYTYTTDETFQAAKEYFIIYDDVTEQLIWDPSQNRYSDSQGNIYNVGSNIPGNTIYKREFVEGISQMKDRYNNFVSTLQEQTNESITTWFANNKIDNQTYDQLLRTLNTQMGNATEILDMYQSFISQGLDIDKPTITSDTKYLPGKRYYRYNSSTDTYTYLVPGTDYQIDADITTTTYESYHYNDPYILLGESTYQTKLRIYPDEIVFYTNDSRTAYLSNNRLYIEEQTILTKEKIGHWLTYEDDLGNLNTKWVEE